MDYFAIVMESCRWWPACPGNAMGSYFVTAYHLQMCQPYILSSRPACALHRPHQLLCIAFNVPLCHLLTTHCRCSQRSWIRCRLQALRVMLLGPCPSQPNVLLQDLRNPICLHALTILVRMVLALATALSFLRICQRDNTLKDHECGPKCSRIFRILSFCSRRCSRRASRRQRGRGRSFTHSSPIGAGNVS